MCTKYEVMQAVTRVLNAVTVNGEPLVWTRLVNEPIGDMERGLSVEGGPDVLIFTPPPNSFVVGCAIKLQVMGGECDQRQEWAERLGACGWLTLLVDEPTAIASAEKVAWLVQTLFLGVHKGAWGV